MCIFTYLYIYTYHTHHSLLIVFQTNQSRQTKQLLQTTHKIGTVSLKESHTHKCKPTFHWTSNKTLIHITYIYIYINMILHIIFLILSNPFQSTSVFCSDSDFSTESPRLGWLGWLFYEQRTTAKAMG